MLALHKDNRAAYRELSGSGRFRLQDSDLSFHQRSHTMFDHVDSCRADPHDLSHLRHRKLSQGVKIEYLVTFRLRT